MRTTTRAKTSIAIVAALLLVSPRVSWAASDPDVEDLRRELRALQSQVQALRSAISEAAELDRQRAAILSRALKTTGGGSESSPAPAPKTEASQPARASAADTSAHTSSRRAETAAVAARKPAPPPPPAPAEPTPGSIRGKVAIPGGEPVAYVYVENILAAAAKSQRVVIEQSGKKFLPGWAVIQRGTSVSFPNKDNIYHNVFSLSAGNSFDLGLYNAGSEAKSHTFNEAGPVDVYCNIHPSMAASILVVPNRHYAKVKPDGSFEISSVPAGKRKLVAWAPGSRSATEWVEVSPNNVAEVSLKLESKSSSHKNKSGQAYGSYE